MSRATLARIREVLARELETVSLYERFSEEESDPEMKLLFQHLADEEKEHVTETYEAILRRDPKQAAWVTGAHVQAIRGGHLADAVEGSGAPPAPGPAASPQQAQPVVAPVAEAPRPSPRAMGTGPTVGNLYGQSQD